MSVKTVRVIKGVDTLLTLDEVAALAKKPRRWALKVVKSGALKGVKFGGNSWRVSPREWERFVETGATGYRHAKPSGDIARCRVPRGGVEGSSKVLKCASAGGMGMTLETGGG